MQHVQQKYTILGTINEPILKYIYNPTHKPVFSKINCVVQQQKPFYESKRWKQYWRIKRRISVKNTKRQENNPVIQNVSNIKPDIESTIHIPPPLTLQVYRDTINERVKQHKKTRKLYDIINIMKSTSKKNFTRPNLLRYCLENNISIPNMTSFKKELNALIKLNFISKKINYSNRANPGIYTLNNKRIQIAEERFHKRSQHPTSPTTTITL